jgi:outer membrane protein, multidrug efflux system
MAGLTPGHFILRFCFVGGYRLHRLAAIAGFAGLICTAPREAAADPPVPAAFVEASAPQTQIAATSRWWTIFADPRLDALIERGTRDNTDIAIAAARLSLARAALREAKAERLPRIDAIAAVADQSGNLATASGENGSLFELGARASWEPDLFGRLGKTARAAKLDAQGAASLLENARLITQSEIASTWFALRSLDAEHVALGAADASAAQTIAILKQQHRNGTISTLDIDRRRIDLGVIRADALALERQRALTRHALALLVGAESLPEEAPSAADPVVPEIPAGLPSAMLARRPDVAAVIDAVEAARLRHRSAKTSWFPSFSLTANGGQASTTLGQLLSQTAQTFGFNILLSLPIFDGGRNAARVRKAAAETELAQAQQRDTILNAFRDVEDQLAATRLLRQEETVAADTAAAGSRTRGVAERRFANGTISRLSLLDAARADLIAQRRVIQLRHARAIATVALIRALGGGWGEKPVASARPHGLAANDRH